MARKPPSREVVTEASARAQRLAEGLYPHQVAGLSFLLARRSMGNLAARRWGFPLDITCGCVL